MHKTESSLLIILWNVGHKSMLKSHSIYKLLKDTSKWLKSSRCRRSDNPGRAVTFFSSANNTGAFHASFSFPMDKGGASQQDQAALTRNYMGKLAILDT